jgi:polyvinyl alcohol dehydrogenase (cytochrome)
MRRHLFAFGVVVAAAVSMAAPGAGADPHTPGSVSDARGGNWPVYGHDFANTRLNPHEHRINRETVAQLTESWAMHGLVGVSGTPTVAGSRAYFGDWTGTVWAVDARTGRKLWSTAIGGGFIVGAPAVQGNAVYVSNAGTLYRLDRNTGEVVWKVVVNDHPLAQINASPVIVDNLVIQGVASAEVAIPRPQYTFRGSIGAYDSRTGREVWRLYTTANDATSGAGVGVWSTPAIDTRRGMLYVGTGNNYSEPTGPLADSLLAIDYKTGRMVWSRQFTNPDVFSAGNPFGKDADVGASPNLWWSNGRALVGAGDKAGVYHALDRDTGAIVWERTLTPGSIFGGEIGSGAFVDGKLVVVSNVGDPATNSPVDVAKAFALDPATGAVLWEAQPFEGQIYAPVGAVSGIAFVGTNTGLLAALDTDNGARLWTYQAPDKTGCGPSIVNGRVLWGYGFFLFGAPGDGGVISFTVDRTR